MKRTAIEQQEENALEDQKKQIDDEHWYLNIEEKKLESDRYSKMNFRINKPLFFFCSP